jgi:hypothetical protein
MKHSIAQTRNGMAVHVDLLQSPAAAHIAQQPYLLGLVKELVQQTTARGPEMRIDRDMGRPIGYSSLVETSDKDTILYAQLLRDSAFTRFVKNGEPLATQYLSIVLRRDEDGNYELHDTWLGRLTPPSPGSDNETDTSKTYWASHAFVFGNHSVQPRTVTKVCPY